jgi:hypothetical protein
VLVRGAIYHVYCRVGRGVRVFADSGEAAALVEHRDETLAKAVA